MPVSNADYKHEKSEFFKSEKRLILMDIILKFKSWGGYLIDLYRIAIMEFSHPHSYTKFKIINRVRKYVKAKQFIESGTFCGGMARRASFVFKKVYTIEIDPALASYASHQLEDRENVKVFKDDCLRALPLILEADNIEDALVFLDGHFSGGCTGMGDCKEPAKQALEILKQYKRKIAAVVIDDFRTFGTEEGIPKKSDLLKSAESFSGSEFLIGIHLDMLIIERKPKTVFDDRR